jgi:hypothetical protein
MPQSIAWSGIGAALLFGLWGVPWIGQKIPLWPGVLIIFGFATLIGGAVLAIQFWRPPSPSPTELHPVVFDAQFREIRELQDFVGKEEVGLRIEFDIPDILIKNITLQQIRINFFRSGNNGEFPYGLYAENNNYMVWVKEGHYNADRGLINLGESTDKNGVGIVEGQKDVLYLITTKKHQEALSRLDRFLNSLFIPTSIKEPTAALKKVVAKDMELMFIVLDEKMHEDERFFLNYSVQNSPYTNAISNEYVKRFDPLEPS